MIVNKTDPAGLDYSISLLQNHLYNYLAKYWLNDPVIVHNSYGRCERVYSDQGYKAMIFSGNNTESSEDNEYTDVLWDDTVDVVSFFGVNPKTSNGTRQNAEVHLVMFMNLRRIKPLSVHRPDEEARIDILRSFGKCQYGFHYQSFETGIENALREYKGSQKSGTIKTVDMHPVHVVRINFSISYNPFQTPLKLN